MTGWVRKIWPNCFHNENLIKVSLMRKKRFHGYAYDDISVLTEMFLTFCNQHRGVAQGTSRVGPPNPLGPTLLWRLSCNLPHQDMWSAQSLTKSTNKAVLPQGPNSTYSWIGFSISTKQFLTLPQTHIISYTLLIFYICMHIKCIYTCIFIYIYTGHGWGMWLLQSADLDSHPLSNTEWDSST